MTNKTGKSTQDTEIIDQVLREPLLLRRLSDRVYQLLLDDLYHQRDRLPNR